MYFAATMSIKEKANMAFKLLTLAYSVVLLSTVSLAQDELVVEFKKHIEHLEAKIEHLESKHDSEMKYLRKATDIQVAKLNSEIKAQQEATDIQIGQLNSEIKAQKTANALQVAELTRKVRDVDQRMSSLESRNRELVKDLRRSQSNAFRNLLVQKTEKSASGRCVSNECVKGGIGNFPMKAVGKVASTHSKSRDVDAKPVKRALQSETNIAFTAFLDHAENSLGLDATLKFNKILLNDGNGYNVNSGTFTAPVSGVYSFTFFIATRDDRESSATLFVNNTREVDAVAETHATREDAQGGNSAVLKVAAGDIVYVKMLYGDHIESQNSRRLTSFSGFLLYPTEDGPAVIGK